MHKLVVEFHRPARIDDVLEVETRATTVGGARIVLSQMVRREAEVLVTAEVTVVMINGEGQARRLPPGVREVLSGDDSS